MKKSLEDSVNVFGQPRNFSNFVELSLQLFIEFKILQLDLQKKKKKFNIFRFDSVISYNFQKISNL